MKGRGEEREGVSRQEQRATQSRKKGEDAVAGVGQGWWKVRETFQG